VVSRVSSSRAPGIDATTQIDDPGKAPALEVMGDMPTADTVVADDDDFLLRIQGFSGSRDFAHRDERCSLKGGDAVFPGFPDVKQQRFIRAVFYMGLALEGCQFAHCTV